MPRLRYSCEATAWVGGGFGQMMLLPVTRAA